MCRALPSCVARHGDDPTRRSGKGTKYKCSDRNINEWACGLPYAILIFLYLPRRREIDILATVTTGFGGVPFVF
jgi:hypothetical protein